jgi:hypothetical protein
MVSYFEDVPREMEEAALLDRAGRLRALWYVILPQVRGGIAVTTIFVFLNAWNEFLFAVVLGGNRVRPVTVAMFNFISVEQTLWAKLAAGAMLAMAPVDPARAARAAAHRQGSHRRCREGWWKNVTATAPAGPRQHARHRQAPRRVHRAARRRPRYRAGRVLRAARALGLGQGRRTLRILAGLEPLNEGRVMLDGEDVTEREPASVMSRWCSRATRCIRT